MVRVCVCVRERKTEFKGASSAGLRWAHNLNASLTTGLKHLLTNAEAADSPIKTQRAGWSVEERPNPPH